MIAIPFFEILKFKTEFLHFSETSNKDVFNTRKSGLCLVISELILSRLSSSQTTLAFSILLIIETIPFRIRYDFSMTINLVLFIIMLSKLAYIAFKQNFFHQCNFRDHDFIFKCSMRIKVFFKPEQFNKNFIVKGRMAKRRKVFNYNIL